MKPEMVNSYTLSLNSALDMGMCSTPGRGRFTPEKRLYLLCTRLGEPHRQSERVLKISPPTGFDLRTVQHAMSRSTDYVSG
jgi:hypothetical protein